MPKPKSDNEGRSHLPQSRITTGSTFLEGIDGRSSYARRWRDLTALHIADLGGADQCSTAVKSIVRRIATLSVQLEAYDARFAEAGIAEPGGLDLYSRISNTLRRHLETIGLKRVAKDITPHLADYLEEKA